MKFLKSLIAMLFVSCQTVQPGPPAPVSFVVTPKTIQILGFMDEVSLPHATAQMNYTAENETVYLYIYSYGGEYSMLPQFLESMKKRHTVCFADLAGGPAYAILQACSVRLVGFTSGLGNIRPEATLTGTATKLIADAAKVEQLERDILGPVADRLGVGYDDLLDKADAAKEFTSAPAAIKENQADGVAALSCTPETNLLELHLTYKLIVPAVLTVSGCPIDRQTTDQYPQKLYEILGIPVKTTAQPDAL